jgi:O-antigen ligase
MSKSALSVVSKLLAGTAFFATIVVTPWLTIDPINAPKLAVIALGGFMSLGALLVHRGIFSQKTVRPILLLALAFLIDLALVFFLAGTNPNQEFFGTYGRSTGLLAYFSLCFLLVAAVVAYSEELVNRVKGALLIAGTLSIFYGLIQAFGLDPFPWVNQYTPVFGFLGNPNFQSSFLGLTAVFVLALTLGSLKKAPILIGYVTYQLIALYVIYRTESQQGLLVFAGGAGIVLVLWIRTSKFKVLAIPAYATSAMGFFAVTLGSLNSGPLAGLLYKESVTYRGDYWRAGIKMGLDHPIFGVGLDSYGEWYRRARTIEATLRRGPEIISNAAHNVVIDFFANGGFPLAMIYVSLMVLVLRSCYLVLKRTDKFNPTFVGLVAVWCAYQAQSIISLNQLGLAVWGWIISGLLIGYEINTRDTQFIDESKDVSSKGKNSKKVGKAEVAPATIIGVFLGLLAGAILSLPSLIASAQHKSALESGSYERVVVLAYSWPTDPYRMVQVASVLAGSKFEKEALGVILDATRKFPNEYRVWESLFKAPNATEEQKTEALAQMKRLDPLNPNLK